MAGSPLWAQGRPHFPGPVRLGLWLVGRCCVGHELLLGERALGSPAIALGIPDDTTARRWGHPHHRVPMTVWSRASCLLDVQHEWETWVMLNPWEVLELWHHTVVDPNRENEEMEESGDSPKVTGSRRAALWTQCQLPHWVESFLQN